VGKKLQENSRGTSLDRESFYVKGKTIMLQRVVLGSLTLQGRLHGDTEFVGCHTLSKDPQYVQINIVGKAEGSAPGGRHQRLSSHAITVIGCEH
jgi:hypothetical protein